MKTLIDRLVEHAVTEATEEQLRDFYADYMYSFFGKMSIDELQECEEDLN
jgi:hypothetical protein